MARAGIIYYTISSLDQEQNEWRSTALNQSNPINYSRSLCLILINSDLMGISWWWSCCCAFLHSRLLPLIHNTDIKRYSEGRRLHSSADVNVGNIAGGRTKEKYSTPVGGREAKIIYIPAVGPLRPLSLAVPQHTSIGSKGGWRQDRTGWRRMKMMMVILAKLFSNGDSKRNPLQLGRLEWGTRYLKRNAFPRFSSCILTRTSTVRYQSRIIYLSQAKRIPIPGLCTKALDIILYSLSCNCCSCSSSPRCVIIRWSM